MSAICSTELNSTVQILSRPVFLLRQPVSAHHCSISTPPLDFAATWLRERLFEQKPKSLPIPVAPTREFCDALFTSKIEATIGNIGDMIGWEDDNNTVGPIAAAAKQSLLRLIPHIMPADSDQTSLYRLVLEHGDFGIHNMSITMDANGQPLVTSLYDWETGCIVPAILSDPLMAVWVDLVTDENVAPSFIRVPDDATYAMGEAIFHGSLQSSAQLRTCNPGRERRTPPLVCVARVAR